LSTAKDHGPAASHGGTEGVSLTDLDFIEGEWGQGWPVLRLGLPVYLTGRWRR